MCILLPNLLHSNTDHNLVEGNLVVSTMEFIQIDAKRIIKILHYHQIMADIALAANIQEMFVMDLQGNLAMWEQMAKISQFQLLLFATI